MSIRHATRTSPQPAARPGLIERAASAIVNRKSPTRIGVERAVNDFRSAVTDSRTMSRDQLQAQVNEARARNEAMGLAQVQTGAHRGEWWPVEQLDQVEGKDHLEANIGDNPTTVGLLNAWRDISSAVSDGLHKSPEELQAAVDESRAKLIADGYRQVQTGAHKGEWWPKDKIDQVEGKDHLEANIGDSPRTIGLLNAWRDITSAISDGLHKSPEELQAAVDDGRAKLEADGFRQVQTGAHRGEWWPADKIDQVEGKDRIEARIGDNPTTVGVFNAIRDITSAIREGWSGKPAV
jgi:hypothetical protein